MNPQARLHWLVCGELHIVFNAASGQTHVLNELGTAILRLFAQLPLSFAEVAEHLVTQYTELHLDEELCAAVESLLFELDALGLIEPLPNETNCLVGN